MGFGSSGGVKAYRLPVVLVYLTISCVILLALGACGGEEPTPVPPPTTAPVVIAAPPVQPAPTLPPMATEEPAAEPDGPMSTPLVVVPGNRFSSRAPTAEPTPTPPPSPTAEPTATPQPEPTATPLPRPTPTSTVVIRPNPPTATPVPQRNPSISVSPGSGQPGTGIIVAGKDFAPGSAVGAVSFGGVSAAPNPSVTVDSLGSFYATIVVPEVSAGSYNLSMTVGTDSATASFTVQAAPSGPTVPPGSPIITTLAPLSGNLQWVAYFDNGTKSWSLYDRSGSVTINELPNFPPKPGSLSDYAPLTQLTSGKSYTFSVSQDVTITLGGKERELTTGQNVVVW